MGAGGVNETDAALYFGRVTHQRLRPVRHKLAYNVFSLLIDIERLDEIAGRLRLFSRNRFNLFSFYDRDYGHGRPDDLAAHIRQTLSDAGVAAEGPIRLLCYPRILGYAFNPLSIYYCEDRAGTVRAVIYEVRNTFGGRHSYLIETDGDGVIRQTAEKALHVSPFMEMETAYNFRLTAPDESIAVGILQTDAEGPIFSAAFSGRRVAATDRAFLSAFVRYPLMTLKVILAIHFEAVKLMLKGMRLLKGGPDPAQTVTVVASRTLPRDKAA
jgi:DUF1365 family protein